MPYRAKPRITSPADYASAMARIGELMRDETELRELTAAVHDYERDHFPIDAPTPHEAIKFRMEQMGLRPRDVEDIFGSRGKTSEVLSGKRGLSIAMIRKCRERLGIPADILIGHGGLKD